jgi:hypothetical protein
MNTGGEAVSMARDSLDVIGIPERVAQRRGVSGEVAFFDKTVRPDCVDQLVFGQHVAAVLNQQQENLEDLWRQFISPLSLICRAIIW